MSCRSHHQTKGLMDVSKLTEGSWSPSKNPVVVAFVVGAVALAEAFGWRPPTDWVNTATDVLGLAVAAYAALKARSKVTPL